MTKREAAETQKARLPSSGSRYPGVHGKVVDWAEHVLGGHALCPRSLYRQDRAVLGSPDGSRDPRSRAERLENWELQAAETIRRERKRNEAQHLVVVQLARARILGL